MTPVNDSRTSGLRPDGQGGSVDSGAGAPVRVVVTGSRTWKDIATVYKRIGELPKGSILIHGGAEGADQMADQAAQLHGLHTARVAPLYKSFGGKAPHVRNAAMLTLDPDLVLAFSLGTNGTQSTIDKARAKGIPVEVIGTERGATPSPSADHEAAPEAAVRPPLNRGPFVTPTPVQKETLNG